MACSVETVFVIPVLWVHMPRTAMECGNGDGDGVCCVEMAFVVWRRHLSCGDGVCCVGGGGGDGVFHVETAFVVWVQQWGVWRQHCIWVQWWECMATSFCRVGSVVGVLGAWRQHITKTLECGCYAHHKYEPLHYHPLLCHKVA